MRSKKTIGHTASAKRPDQRQQMTSLHIACSTEAPSSCAPVQAQVCGSALDVQGTKWKERLGGRIRPPNPSSQALFERSVACAEGSIASKESGIASNE
jgi:hypothetical protein